MTGNTVFLLEVIVHRVTLTDPDQATNTCPACACFRFAGLVDMEICQGDFCGGGGGGGGADITMGSGKSCLFAVAARDLCRVAREFCADVSVYRRTAQGPAHTRLVGQSRIEFDASFVDFVQDPDQRPTRTRTLRRTLSLYEKDRTKPVGNMDVSVWLSSQGELVATQYNLDPDTGKFDYKSVDHYTPTDAKLRKACVDKKRCSGHREKTVRPCSRKSAAEKNEVCPVLCDKYTGRVERIMTAMKMMKQLFDRATKAPAKPGGDWLPCMFDECCPIADCPFRFDVNRDFLNQDADQTTESVDGEQKTADVLVEDDADLFALRLGRVDPCQVREKVQREMSTQYLNTDISASYFPVLSESESKPAKSKKNKKKNKKKKK